ncbi:thiamine phosphate synthase [Campylobacter sp. MIT 12-8780]|uniref:thiamine phosphate synthase n=1 Tax=unclassified Campylobacter TaxID=2593542 RepID=UPI00115DF1DF|nr:thiamine phosphate synthase [Campylobacter sp. MIT 12-8780]NDJ26650.1 thiamine phosphate synthase [Campylobacter sp. MIT 19-121]TQR42521.1 thiamine phosphate synthase [Campylobacter sp. MIT 12-8780]
MSFDKNKLDLSLYLVASRQKRSDESFLNQVKNAILGGVSVVQLREKELSSREFFELGLKLKRLCDELCVPLLINDRLDIALALECAGVHLGQDDLSVNVARQLLGEQKIIGLSVKTLAQLKNTAGADYLGCGAVFPSLSKESELIGVKGVKELALNTNLKVVAIGGIDENNVLELGSSKIAGIAVIRALMESANAYETALRLKASIRQIKETR